MHKLIYAYICPLLKTCAVLKAYSGSFGGMNFSCNIFQVFSNVV